MICLDRARLNLLQDGDDSTKIVIPLVDLRNLNIIIGKEYQSISYLLGNYWWDCYQRESVGAAGHAT
jgi:hypothetical protein